VFGLLNLHKPPGRTSRDAVDRVQRIMAPVKVGHAGTLDPLATGVLVVCLGPATRLVEYVQRMPKTYRGTFLLGRSSPTEDVDGEVQLLANPPIPTLSELEAAARRLTGTILQRPPAYSALKVAGRRAYRQARAGQEVVLEPREITVGRLEIVRYGYPELELDLDCSSGTYVRSLGRDLAESVGTAAVMSALVRTAVGPFRVEHALPLDQLSLATIAQRLEPPEAALSGMPRQDLSAEQAARVRLGQPLDLPGQAAPELAAFDPQRGLAAVLVRRGAQYFPAKNFLAASLHAP
jgi:tRNA pseudouridine55 synthase